MRGGPVSPDPEGEAQGHKEEKPLRLPPSLQEMRDRDESLPRDANHSVLVVRKHARCGP